MRGLLFLLLVGFTLSGRPPPSPPAPPTGGAGGGAYAVGSQGQLALLNGHNTVRAGKAVLPLVWDTTLATAAAVYAAKCLYPAHDPIRNTDPRWAAFGENGGLGPASFYTGQTLAGVVFNAWVAEVEFYYPGRPSGSDCVAGKVCGHYTQVMWNTTTHLGCGYYNCPRTSLTNMQATETMVAIYCRYGRGASWPGPPAYETASGSQRTNDGSLAKLMNRSNPALLLGLMIVVLAVAVVILMVKLVHRSRSHSSAPLYEEMTTSTSEEVI